MNPDLLHNSWRRLWWIEKQIEEIRILSSEWLRLPEFAALTTCIDEGSTIPGRADFSIDVVRPLLPPEEVNFLLGNIVTDARSCLDMAIEAIWAHYSLPRRSRKNGRLSIQFPLEDDFPAKCESNGRLREFIGHFDPRFARVIRDAQPNYVDGMLDIPMNVIGVFIRNFSNANKHRNITPVEMAYELGLYGVNRGDLELSVMGGAPEHASPPWNFQLSYDIQMHSEPEIHLAISQLETRHPSLLSVPVRQSLSVTGDKVPIFPIGVPGPEFVWRASLEYYLGEIPSYVRGILEGLDMAHGAVCNDEDWLYFSSLPVN